MRPPLSRTSIVVPGGTEAPSVTVTSSKGLTLAFESARLTAAGGGSFGACEAEVTHPDVAPRTKAPENRTERINEGRQVPLFIGAVGHNPKRTPRSAAAFSLGFTGSCFFEYSKSRMPHTSSFFFRAGALLLLSLCTFAVACKSSTGAFDDDTNETPTGGTKSDGGNQGGNGDEDGGGGSSGQGGGGNATAGANGGGMKGSPDAMPDVAPASPYATCIMPLGDSITQADLQNLSYRYWLWKQLTDNGYKFGFVGSVRTRELRDAKKPVLPFPEPGFDVDHQGHWGKKPSEILALMKAAPAWEKQIPGIVLLHAGTNEIWSLGSDSVDTVKQRAATGIGQIIDYLRTKNDTVIILISKIIPLDTLKYGEGIEDAISAINEQIVALAAMKTTAKSPVVLVDQATGFGDQDLLPDGIHPNQLGEKKMASKWLTALEPFLKAAGGVPCPL